MTTWQKKILSKIIAFCLILSAFCFDTIDTDNLSSRFLCHNEQNSSLIINLSTHDDVYYYDTTSDNLSLTGKLSSTRGKQNYQKTKLLSSPFGIKDLFNLTLLFFILANWYQFDICTSHTQIIRYIHNQDGKKSLN